MTDDGSIGHYSFPREWEEIMSYAYRFYRYADGRSERFMSHLST